jgi:hypothetical protein
MNNDDVKDVINIMTSGGPTEVKSDVKGQVGTTEQEALEAEVGRGNADRRESMIVANNPPTTATNMQLRRQTQQNIMTIMNMRLMTTDDDA